MAHDDHHAATAGAKAQPSTNKHLALFRDLVSFHPMEISRGTAYTLLAMASMSYEAHEAGDHPEQRIVRSSYNEIGKRARAGRHTVARDIKWAVDNGWLKTVKKPKSGVGSRGVWILLTPGFQIPSVDDREHWTRSFTLLLEEFADLPGAPELTPNRASSLSRQSEDAPESEQERSDVGAFALSRQSEDAPESEHGSSDHRALPSPVTPATPVLPSPPAVPPFGRRPVPGSSGPRPGLPALVADDVLGEPQRVDDSDQPQDARADAGAQPLTWAQEMAAKIKDEWDAGRSEGGRMVSDGPVPAPRGGVPVM